MTPQNTPPTIEYIQKGLALVGEPSEAVGLVEWDKRVVQARTIVKYLIEGLNFTEIAIEMGLDRRTVYNIRHSIEYGLFFNSLLDSLLIDIVRFSESDSPTMQVEALRVKDRLVRAGITKKSYSRSESAEVKVIMDARKQKRQDNAWIGDLTPEEFDQLTQHKTDIESLKRAVEDRKQA